MATDTEPLPGHPPLEPLKATEPPDMTQVSYRISAISEPELEDLVLAERLSWTYHDDCLDIEQTRPWCLDRESLLRIIRSRSDDPTSFGDTLTFTVHCDILADDEEILLTKVCGGFSYSVEDDHYRLVFVTTHPDFPFATVLSKVASFMRDKAKKSHKRKRITVWLRDSDEARLRELLPQWQRQGFQFKLVRDHYGDCDGWLGTFSAEKSSAG
jgi:hypothetical protein